MKPLKTLCAWVVTTVASIALVSLAWLCLGIGEAACSHVPRPPECRTVLMVDDQGAPWVCCGDQAEQRCLRQER